jgi:cytochrome c556
MQISMTSGARSLAAAAVIAAFAASAPAHDGATGVIKQRMDNMSAMGKAMKAIATMVKDESQYDTEAFRTALNTISTHSGDNLTRLFPSGSIGDPSEAKQDIWEKWETFEALSAELNRQATGLALLSTRPKPAQFGKLAATCKGCHEQFRTRKN